MDVEQRVREMLAHVFSCDPEELSKDEVRAARAVLAYQAALTPPEGYVLVPVETQKDAERFQWLKKCSREQYLLARGMFGLADDVIDTVIRDEAKEASNGK
jgi:hypothetical protein